MFTNLPNPFIGLRAFESHESLLYFGRQEQTLQLLKRLHQNHFLAVIGGSGSGKSSLVKAGLIPGLKAGYIVKSRDKWVVSSMRPGQDPLRNLVGTILQSRPGMQLTEDELLSQFYREGADVLLQVLKPTWEQEGSNFFLLVDQFEELFRFSLTDGDPKKKDEANEFVKAILFLSQQVELPVYVAITMRSDFIGDCAQFSRLPESLNQSQYLVPRLTRTQLKSTIESPVELFGGKINPNLTSRLLNDAQKAQDELPLLQHALMRIWQHEKDEDNNGELDLDDYTFIGTLELALSNHAEEAYETAAAEDKPTIKKIFQALTTVDGNARKTRRPATLKKLTELTGASSDKVMELIRRFVNGNRCFFIIDENGPDTLIDISHESLIRRWTTLSKWVDDEYDAKKNLEKLVLYSSVDTTGEKKLLADVELQQLLKWRQEFKPTPTWAIQYNAKAVEGLNYLEESGKRWIKEQAEEKSRQQWKVYRLIIGFAATILLCTIGFYWYKTASERNYVSRRIENYLFASASAYKDKKEVKGLHLFAEALTLGNRPDSVFHFAVKLDSATKKLHLDGPFFFYSQKLPALILQRILDQNTRIKNLLFSVDDALLATVNEDGIARLWNLRDGLPSDSIQLKKIDRLDQFTFLQEKWSVNSIVDSSNTIQKQLLDTWGVELDSTQLPLERFGRTPSDFIQIDGVSGSNDSLIALWGVTTETNYDAASVWSNQTGELVGNLMMKDRVQGVYIGKDSKSIYVSGDSTIQVWMKPAGVPNILSDPDIPGSLFKLQAQVATGVYLDPIRQQLQLLPVAKWKMLRDEYRTEGAKHYKNCRFKPNNYWKIITDAGW